MGGRSATSYRRAVVSEDAVRRLLEVAAEQGPLMAPVKRGRTAFAFEWIDDPRRVELTYARTVLPPKRAMFPERETLLHFARAPECRASPQIAAEPYLLFGVHPCDLAAIAQLDWAMGERHQIADPNYLARRRAATIVGIDCLPDEHCFCPSVGTCDSRAGADLFLTPIASGYLAEVLADKGAALLEAAGGGREPSPQQTAEAEQWPQRKRQETVCRLDAPVEDLPDILEARYDSDIWEATAERCYSCGTCTNVCPTCFCFDVEDHLDLPLRAGTRERSYDSCQFLDFAVVAGGHNFRRERGDRVRHRWFRKFAYLLREHGRAFCVGCGRCTQACTAGIGLTSVLNALIAEARESVA